MTTMLSLVREEPRGGVQDAWAEAIDGFETWLMAGGASKSTLRMRRCYVQQLARRGVGPWDMTLTELVRFLSQPAWSAETRHAAKTSVRRFYDWGTKVGRITTNPALDLPTIRIQRGNPRPVAEDALEQALENADERTRAMIMLAAYAGLRRSEIAGLHSRDVGQTAIRVVGKGGKVRMVPLHPVLRAALPKTDGYLFPPGARGADHLSASYVGEALKKALGEYYTGHQLRHRFATAAYAVDRDLLAVQELLGHASPVTTRMYTAVPEDAMSKAVLGAGPRTAV